MHLFIVLTFVHSTRRSKKFDCVLIFRIPMDSFQLQPQFCNTYLFVNSRLELWKLWDCYLSTYLPTYLLTYLRTCLALDFLSSINIPGCRYCICGRKLSETKQVPGKCPVYCNALVEQLSLCQAIIVAVVWRWCGGR